MPTPPRTTALTLRRLFKRLILTSIAIPACVVPVVACSGGPGDIAEGESAGQGDTNGGANGETVGGGGVGSDRAPSQAAKGECRAAEATDAPVCGPYRVTLTGDQSTCAFDAEGTGTDDFCAKVCGKSYVSRCKRADSTSVECNAPCAVDGRRYALLDDVTASRAVDVGTYLARMAFFEAASVDSFLLLERELEMHGAPGSLLRSCASARRDEVRHARMATKLARRHAREVVVPPALPALSPRSLEEIAIENVVEGCVRETFGVIIGLFQSENAPTKELRAFFGALAEDEARHASLALRVDAWLRSRLPVAARRRVEAARQRALIDLEAALAIEPLAGLGLPSADQARSLFSSWAALDLAA